MIGAILGVALAGLVAAISVAAIRADLRRKRGEAGDGDWSWFDGGADGGTDGGGGCGGGDGGGCD